MKRILVLIGYFLLLCAGAASGYSGHEYNQLGVKAMQEGRFDEAISYLSEAFRDQPSNTVIKNNLSVAYNNAALEYDKRGQFDRACDLMKKAYQLEPDSKNVKRNMAMLYTNEGFRRYNERRGEDITRLLMDALEYDDRLAETHLLLGQVYYERDDYFQAQQQWKTALQINPSMPEVQKKLDKLEKEMADDQGRQDQQKYHFKVRYEGAELWTASRDALDMLEEAFYEAGRKFGYYPEQQLTAIIYTQEKFQSVSGVSDWIAGVYDGKIRLRRSDVEGNKDRLRQIVYHEYMHAFVHSLAGRKIPTWLNEGIAQCYEKMPQKAELTTAERQLLKQRLTREGPNLDQIDQMFLSQNSATDVQFAYACSKAFVSYIIDRGWDYNIRNLLEELKKGMPVDAAFQKVYFGSVERMRNDWLYYRNDTTPY